MTQPLTYDILAKDHMSAVFREIVAVSEKMTGALKKVGSDAKEMGNKLGGAEKDTTKFGASTERAGGKLSWVAGKLRTAAAAASNLGSKLSGIGTRAISVGVAIGNLASNAITALASSAASVVSFGVSTAAANEQAMVSFTLLLGSAKKAKDFLGRLQQFAAATPFDLPSLKDVASKLLSVGVHTKDIIPLMTRLGDATAGMGTGAEGIERAVYALQQMKQAGHVQLGDINQLTQAGIPMLDALAAKMHTTVAKVRKDISKGKIKVSDVFGAIESGAGPGFARLHGMMDKQSATLTGVWSSFKDNASQALGNAFAPALPTLKLAVNWLGTSLPRAINLAIGLGKKFAAIFAGTGLAASLKTMFDSFKSEGVKNVQHAIEGLFNMIKNHKREIGILIKSIAYGFGFIVAQVLPRVISGFSGIIDITVHIIGAFEWMFAKITDALAGILNASAEAFSWVPGLGPKLKSAAAKVSAFRDQVNGYLSGIHRNIHVGVTYKVKGSGGSLYAAINSKMVASARALGGPVRRGQPYVVGEQRPELFVPDSDGRIEPRVPSLAPHGTGGGGDVQAPLQITLPGIGVIWQGLLRYKKDTGKLSLGLG